MTQLLDVRLFASALAAQVGLPDHSALEHELCQEWNLRTSIERLVDYAATCPVDGSVPNDYTLRKVTVPGGEVLAGIHFKGLDVRQPFVGVLASTVTDPAVMPAVARSLIGQWELFNPRSIRVFLGADNPIPEYSHPDQHLLVGDIAGLRERVAPTHLERVQLVRSSDSSALATWIAGLYTEIYARRPELVDRVIAADANELAECARAGALFEVRVDATKVGLVGARPGRQLGFVGAEIVEEVLDPRWWGQGLGPVLQHCLVDALPNELSPWVWGTIDASNQASLRTALRSGRHQVGTWWFVYP